MSESHSSNQIKDLFEKYLNNQCSADEVRQLMNFFKADESHLLDNLIIKELERTDNDSPGPNYQPLLNTVYKRIHADIHAKRRNTLMHRIRVAASIILILSFGGYFIQRAILRNSGKEKTKALATDVAPGGNKAILELANGKKIILESTKNGVISQQGNSAVNKVTSGNLVYNNLHQNEENTITYNNITIPYGGQYQVTLQDGTKIWLNSGSSLRFPTSFPGKERVVQLTGEAYFEVAKDTRKPFLVNVNTGSGKSMTVRVLGTHFNVNAYLEEGDITTTLLEGSVKLDYGPTNALLRPGKEAILNKSSGNIKINEADTEARVAWKNGYFIFNNDKIENIMRQISRWYDVEVVYQGDVSKKAIGGSLSRYKNVSAILKMLEMTGAVHFKIEGRRITVMP